MQSPLQITQHSLDLAPILFVWRPHSRGRKAVVGWMSHCALALRNRSCAVVQWNAIACSSGNTFARDKSLTVNDGLRQGTFSSLQSPRGYVLDDVLDVLHHGNHHHSFHQEIKDNAEVVVDLSPVGGHCHSILSAQPFFEDSDLGWITAVQHFQIIDMPTHRHLLPVHNLVGRTQIIWIQHEPITFY